MQARRRFYLAEENYVNNTVNPITIENDPNEDLKKNTKSWNYRDISNRISSSVKTFQNIVNSKHKSVDVDSNLNRMRDYPTSLENKISEENFDDSNNIEIEVTVMSSRDRTPEFINAVQTLQNRNISQALSIKDPKKVKQIQSYAEFMMVSKYIGKNIANTYSKLEKLTILAKRKTLFNDRPAEIQELSHMIKCDLNSLNQQIARLQEISRRQRKPSSGKHLISHSSNMVLALQSKLANMSTEFKQILEVRTENLKHQKTRRDQFSQGPILYGESSSVKKHGGSILLNEDNHISIDVNDDDKKPLLSKTQIQISEHDVSDTYIKDRAETMQNIESTIVELGGIFQQLAHMVKEQEEIVERIDGNVEDTEMNIEGAHSEILKYFQSVSKNRWIIIKILSVLIFFFIFFVTFLT